MSSCSPSYRQEQSAFWDIVDQFNDEPQYWVIIGGIASILGLMVLGYLGVF